MTMNCYFMRLRLKKISLSHKGNYDIILGILPDEKYLINDSHIEY